MIGRNLNNFDVTVQSWYSVCRSSKVRPGKVKGFTILNRKIALYRDSNGRIYALDARCSHMGADLSLGKVVGCCLQCPLHKWEYDSEGRVASAPYEREIPQRRVRAYPTAEKYGHVWIFNGPESLFDIPDIDANRYRALGLPSRYINNHPHFLTANGLDWRHLDTLHDMQFSKQSQWFKKGEYGVEVEHWGRPKNRLFQLLTWTAKKDFNASFETMGANIAIISVRIPVDFFILFSNTPTNDKRSRLTAVAFLPRRDPFSFLKALWVYLFLTGFVLLYKDHKIFNTTDFIPGFTDVDEPFRMFGEIVDKLPTY
ncbi:MAG: Rieske (2Fe-2S) protein [bacterium]|nr:Rieske (2Fe-2S) protein [bacterium]